MTRASLLVLAIMAASPAMAEPHDPTVYEDNVPRWVNYREDFTIVGPTFKGRQIIVTPSQLYDDEDMPHVP